MLPTSIFFGSEIGTAAERSSSVAFGPADGESGRGKAAVAVQGEGQIPEVLPVKGEVVGYFLWDENSGEV